MNHSATLFIAPATRPESLANMAAMVFRLLRLTETEERESSNYPPDEHYFVGYAENIVVSICDDDADVKPDYPFHVWLEEPVSWQRERGGNRISAELREVATTLAAGGLKVFIPHGAWYRIDWDGRGDEYAA